MTNNPFSLHSLILLAGLLLSGCLHARNQCQASEPVAVDAARRPAWTTSRVTGSPEPPTPYSSERVFTALTFDRPTEMTFIPGTNRLLMAELMGKLVHPEIFGEAAAAELGALEGAPLAR